MLDKFNVKLNIMASGEVMSVFIDMDRLTLEKLGQNKALVDKMSATIILQSYMEQQDMIKQRNNEI